MNEKLQKVSPLLDIFQVNCRNPWFREFWAKHHRWVGGWDNCYNFECSLLIAQVPAERIERSLHGEGGAGTPAGGPCAFRQ